MVQGVLSVYQRLLVAAGLTVILLAPSTVAAPVPWVNGDFEQGDLTWTLASTTVVGDHDGDNDQEALLVGSGAGTWQISKGAGKGLAPASAPIGFNIERGSLVYDLRMIIACAVEPLPYANNFLPQADWLDDQVLSWQRWSGASGPQYLDPVQATGINIDGWQDMTPQQRAAYLDGCLHMTMALYAVASGFQDGATVDNFLFHL